MENRLASMRLISHASDPIRSMGSVGVRHVLSSGDPGVRAPGHPDGRIIARCRLTDPLEDFLPLLDAARDLGIHPDSLRKMANRGAVPGAFKWRGKQWLFERHALQTFAETYRGVPGRPPKGSFDVPRESR